MAFDLRIEAKLKLGQTLAMTPRLQQAIKLLQYTHQEMVTHVQEALLENPVLEAVPDSEGGGLSEADRQSQALGANASADLSEQQNGASDSVDWEKFLAQMHESSSPQPFSGSQFDDMPPIEANLTYGESLSGHLLWQLKMMRCGRDEIKAAEEIVQNLDDRGYLQLSLEEVAEASQVDFEAVRDGLDLVLSLDPIGCGARDLSECLVVQAKVLFPEDENFVPILQDHLTHLERRNYQAIASDLDLHLEDVVEYHRMIQDLEPHPGRRFSSGEPRYITPDVYVKKRGDEWYVSLNEDGMPDLKISGYYQTIMANAKKEEKDYIIDKLRNAEFLIKSINKRRKTIVRVVESLIKFQKDFFEYGPGRLRPLVLQDVADDIEMHMSTVSRVTTGKYVHTSHGIFELKYFFTSSVRQLSGEDMAAEAIKGKIKSLVDGENGKKPLSDQAIANALKESGVQVARRTVAKYREALGILPSSKRKQMF